MSERGGLSVLKDFGGWGDGLSEKRCSRLDKTGVCVFHLLPRRFNSLRQAFSHKKPPSSAPLSFLHHTLFLGFSKTGKGSCYGDCWKSGGDTAMGALRLLLASLMCARRLGVRQGTGRGAWVFWNRIYLAAWEGVCVSESREGCGDGC